VIWVVFALGVCVGVCAALTFGFVKMVRHERYLRRQKEWDIYISGAKTGTNGRVRI
jgi:hypothetical protein